VKKRGSAIAHTRLFINGLSTLERNGRRLSAESVTPIRIVQTNPAPWLSRIPWRDLPPKQKTLPPDYTDGLQTGEGPYRFNEHLAA